MVGVVNHLFYWYQIIMQDFFCHKTVLTCSETTLFSDTHLHPDTLYIDAIQVHCYILSC